MKLSKLKKIVCKNYIKYFNEIRYFQYIQKETIREKAIFIEPQQGRSISGNMFYLIKELVRNESYKDYTVYVALQKKAIASAKNILSKNGMHSVHIIPLLSLNYYKLLASCKYLMTDTSFLPAFIKREGQVLLNTWHGTPLKCLGRKSKNDYFSIGNVQKNFLAADYLLYPNEYTRDHLIEDYMLENIGRAKVLLAGYPRNTVFFDGKDRNTIKQELGLEAKEIFAYMPTWREGKDQTELDENQKILLNNLTEIEHQLKENQILFVNLHPLDKNGVDFTKFKKIKEFPKQYETYQFLNIADCLITDYSSVFFDFAITKRKIILFAYDEEKYLKNRGLYFDYRELPFEKATTLSELIQKMNTQSSRDITEFIQKFCHYDNQNICEKICEKIIFGKNNDLSVQTIKNNGKENVLLYVGNLARNGITSSLKNLLLNIDTHAKNYYITFATNKMEINKEQLLDLPSHIHYIATTGKTNMSLCQKIKFSLFRKNRLSTKWIKKDISLIYSYEIQRLYPCTEFNTVIQFSGYDYRKILFYSQFKCNTVIYVHSDMLNEIKTRKIQHRRTLEYAYKIYKKVAVVNEDLIEPTVQISHKRENIYVANNLINYEDVLEKAKENKIVFDELTESNCSLEQINKILASQDKKFITIGRFSPEKGHKRLIQAFNRIYEENKNAYLFIIGGNGVKYEETANFIKTLPCGKHIVLIKTINNPYTILKQCDYFVLSSFYEGFGIVIAEADILNKPVISTDVIGPRKFIKENGGVLVENSEDGLYQGMQQLLKGQVQVMHVDYQKYNQHAIQEFYKLF